MRNIDRAADVARRIRRRLAEGADAELGPLWIERYLKAEFDAVAKDADAHPPR